MKKYKFKDVKHSVTMILRDIDNAGNCTLEHEYYHGLMYHSHISKLEEVKDEKK